MLGGATGLVLSVVLPILGPAVWVKVMGNALPIFPLDPPTLVALPAAVLVCILVSVFDRSRRGLLDRAGFEGSTATPRAAPQGAAMPAPAE